jgi:hypothetical protein
MGKIATSCSRVAKDADGNSPTWEALRKANDVVEFLKSTSKDHFLWYPRMGMEEKSPDSSDWCSWLGLCVVSDSAFANLSTKHSQGGFVILLCWLTDENQVGGFSHVLDFSSQRSTRVARSTYAAELLALVKALERAELLLDWLSEMWYGLPEDGIRGQINRGPMMKMSAVVDAKGLFDSLSAIDMGKLTDKTMLLYALSVRELLKIGLVLQLVWIPTEAMLADDLTKEMEPSGNWQVLYRTGWWTPQHRPDLLEDCVTFSPRDGSTKRWRVAIDWKAW